MIYQPSNGKFWDTWLYFHQGTYYLYYLNSPREGVGLATSDDGVYWKEVGLVIPCAADANWLGTGAVWKSPDFERSGRFICNFSEWRNGRPQEESPKDGAQTIFIAESTDLVHWRRRDEFEFKQDARWYKPAGRWDCIYPLPRGDGGYYGYWTAEPKDFIGVGFGQTSDGQTWTALPPPRIDWGGMCPMTNCEAGAVERIGARYYMLLGSWKHLGHPGGMYTLVAERPEGPFRPAPKNFALLASYSEHFSAYFARFFPSPDGLLVNHQSIPRDGKCFMGLLKRAVVDAEGTLRLGWWEGNEKLKAQPISVKVPADPARPGVARLAESFDLEEGIVLEGVFSSIPTETAQTSDGVGLYVEEDQQRGTAIVMRSRRLVEYGSMNKDGSGFVREDWVDRELDFGPQCRFRLLLRKSFSELYINDVLIQCRSLPPAHTGRIGVIGGPGQVSDLRAWRRGHA